MLTAPVSQVALPVHTRQNVWETLLPVLMEPGTYCVEPEPFGPPWREWSAVGDDVAADRGVFAPVFALSFGPRGAIGVAPGDTRGTVLIPERSGGYCRGVDGRDGPNLACERCGAMVATRVDDCGSWQAVWLVPDAVRRTSADEPVRTANWDTLAIDYENTPPIEQSGAWSPLWEAAVGVAIAHLLVVSTGAPVAVPKGQLADIFGRALETLLPQGPGARTMALAGPGLSTSDADIVLVPRHPLTGESWRPPSAADTVPLAANVWLRLAFRGDGLPIPASGGLPDGVLRDDPLPPHPRSVFRPDSQLLLYTLARMREVRQPWLREIYDRVRADPF